ncbi:hypothetical protein P280DRAFT_390868 [Massarina eburnea CBS 473.64]|uniref:CrcB-like protein-domain-containing protein n=1 Tax=Massarina eburnea CBS 473.64 TaxID=1395130 RepID=A0A6A6SDI4_9PLEO|nr:hypothetical protein P280DRAFT_390868 [Massarina eburnea CBS 473.64]
METTLTGLTEVYTHRPAGVPWPGVGSVLHYEESFEDREVNEEQSVAQRYPLRERPLVQLYTISWLVFFSILGTLARLGVEWITYYPNMPVTTNVLWANFGGTLLLGFLQEDRVLFAERKNRTSLSPSDSRSIPRVEDEVEKRDTQFDHLSLKERIPVHIGLTVGFCASFTSFSYFMRDLFLALSNDLVSGNVSILPRNRGWSVSAVLAVAITEVTVCIAALSFGAHIAIFLRPLLSKIPNTNPTRWLNPLSVLLGFGCWLGAIFLTVWPPRNHWRADVLFALVFAPVGCLLRYLLALRLNPLTPNFQLGTFTSNVFGTAVLGMAYVLQRSPLAPAGGAIGGGVLGCQVLEGIIEGFCGCLTTVSTWVAELRALRKNHAYVYGVVSLSVGLGILVIIMGSVRWTNGFAESICAG